MSEKKMSERNRKIQELWTDEAGLKRFYRFVAQNPHIDLHDACQIVSTNPNAGVCYTMKEWNAMGRRIHKGGKAISYLDHNGKKQFVFPDSATYGDTRYRRETYPMKRLLVGLDAFNGTDYADIPQKPFDKIISGVFGYMLEKDFFNSDDETVNRALVEGVAYSLYARTVLPKESGAKIKPLPYDDINENAKLLSRVYICTSLIIDDIEQAYVNKIQTPEIIDDTDEDVVTDEPITPAKDIWEVTAAARSNFADHVALIVNDKFDSGKKKVALGHISRYTQGSYDNTDNSLIIVTDNEKVFNLLSTDGYVLTQQEMVEKELFSEQDYSDYDRAKKDLPSYIEQIAEVKFGVDIEKDGSGVEFKYPDWKEQKPKHPLHPIYEQYMDAQKEKPDAFVVMRLGDFYELFGDKAVRASQLLDLTLTGRDFGLSERVPMCGFPYHVADKYMDVLLHDSGVLLLEGEEEPKYIVSYAEMEEKKQVEEAEEIDDVHEENEEFDEEEKEEPFLKPKPSEKGIQERKRKTSQQLSLFDMDEKTPEEQFIEKQIKEGSGFVQGKFRIFDKYKENPTTTEFANFLRKEYGVGGASANGESLESNGKGLFLELKENGEVKISVKLKWTDVAERIADLIDDDKYFEDYEKDKYWAYKVEQKQRQEEREAEEKVRGKYISMVFSSAPDERKEQIYNYYTNCSDVEEFTSLVQQLHGRNTTDENDVFRVLYNPVGVFIRKKDGSETGYTVSWEETGKRMYELIKNGAYIDKIRIDETDITETQNAETDTETDIIEDNNADLSEILDQSELGGSKQRYKNNVAAIRLLNRLYAEDRVATPEEKKVLAKYVGWGGLSQVFDAQNEQWQAEYKELKSLLSTDDYEKAKGSVLNAHYTSKDVIEGMYKALARMGVKGNNRILEPALGTGNFFGYMPKEIMDGSKLYGVELDTITGKIATKLYPQANVQIKGFEDTTFTNNKFDLMVTNVPFGGYSVFDTDYAKYNFYIHDYFIAKGIDKVRPNGLVAVVTSKGTMDKLNPTVRKYIAERAELLGAIRLPNTAFKQTANTEVVTDILFFQKRAEKINVENADIEWLSTGKDENGFELNNYFINHPEMVLGTLAEEHGLYGAIDLTVKDDGRPLKDAIEQAITNLPENVYDNPESLVDDVHEEGIEADYDVRPLCYKAENGKLYLRQGDKMVEQAIPTSPKDAYQRISGMISIRNRLRHILDIQSKGCSDEQLAEEQRMLNAEYDLFVKKYGNFNGQTNTKLFKEDADSSLLFACEVISEDKKTISKQDVFFKRTIRPYVAPTQTDDCFEALQISKNERGSVDIAYIEELTKKDYDTVLKELGTAVFRNPLAVNQDDKYSGFETAEEYLSGQVVLKLHQAQVYVNQGHSEYNVNVEELEKVQPAPIKANDISVNVGSSWIDKEYYQKFLCELLRLPYYIRYGIQINYNPHDSSWRVDKTGYAKGYKTMEMYSVYGTERAGAYRLFEDLLNQRSTQIYDTVIEDGKERRVLNQTETIAAREKQNKIKDAFKDWIYSDPERREKLEERYNSLFNQNRLPTYDGSYLKFPEMNPAIELRPHQKDAVHRIVSTGNNTLLHHVVGSGKTFTMVASAMKLRQLGLATKPMIVVPNHLVQQWASDFRNLYPNAKLLVTSKEDVDKDHRERFVSKVAMGDWDSIIISQSAFAKINISAERQEQKIREEISRIEQSIESAETHDLPRGAIKNLERIKKNRETQLKKLLDDTKKDNILIFEKLGIDYLFVDEADLYKNLFLYTKMNNVAGISTSASQRASDLQLKVEYINELRGGDKGVVFATGTPISNSMTEMYTMQTYLQKETLERLGIPYFDAWAADFGEKITSLELAPSGQGYRAKTRFAKFTNLPELLTLYRTFADVQTSDMVKLDVPEAERITVAIKPSPSTIELTEQIADRAERIYGGGVDPHVDNMLKVTLDGKKLALDPRCIDTLAPAEEPNKLSECADRVYEIWEKTKDIKGTQVVFCDLATPKTSFDDYVHGENFDAYNELKYKLVQMGIPKDEIAFIHDAGTDNQKQDMFDSVNSGDIRVLIGSTEKCGAGTNVQKHLVALHHLDAPYRPRDLIQRNGRGIRQGNDNNKVQIFTYVTERTFDSYSYQILENKQRFISQIDRGDLTVREAEDIDETTLSYAEIKAITSANPKIKRKMELDSELARLRVLEGQYKKNLYALQDRIRKEFPEQIQRQTLYVERVKSDALTIKENYNPDNFVINIEGINYTDKKEAGKALMDAFMSGGIGVPIAEYCGLKISLDPINTLVDERTVTLTGKGSYQMAIGQSGQGNLQRLENFASEFFKRESKSQARLEQLLQDFETAKKQAEIPFEHSQKIQEISSELTEINAELDLSRKEEVIIEDDNSDGGETYMSLPEDDKTTIPFREEVKAKKKRKPLTEALTRQILKEQENTPDGYVFGYNDGYFEFIGSETQEMADNGGVKSIHTEYGRQYSVITFNEKDFSEVARLLHESGKELVIVEPKPIASYENIIDEEDDLENEQINKEIDFKKEVMDSVESEFNDFKKEILGKTPEEIFYKNFEIHVKTELFETIQDGDYLDAKQYRALYEEKGHILHSLFDDFIGDEYASVDTYYATAEFIRNYCEYYFDDVLKEYESQDNNDTENSEVEQLEQSYISDLDCRNAIDKAISDNYDGERLSDNEFEDELIKIYGEKRVLGILANNVNQRDWDMRFSPQNKEWAKDTPVYIEDDKKDEMLLKSHSAVINGLITRIRNKQEQNKQQNEEEIMPENSNEKTKWLSASVSRNARINRYEKASLFRMPETDEEYSGYAYYVFNSCIKNSTHLVDLQSDSRELSYTLLFKEDDDVVLKKGNDEVILPAKDFIERVNLTPNAAYVREKDETEEKRWVNITIPKEAHIGMYESVSRFIMPKGAENKGMTFYLPNSFVNEDSSTEDGNIRIGIPEDFVITLKDRATDTNLTITPYQLLREMKGAIADDFNYPKPTTPKQENETGDKENDSGWKHIKISGNAKIAEYEKTSLFKTPDDSEYKGMVYCYSNGLIKSDEDGTLNVSIKNDFTVDLKNGKTGETKTLTAEEFASLVDENNGEKQYGKFGNGENIGEKKVYQGTFSQYEQSLIDYVPEEMKAKPNWVAIRTSKNEETGKLNKYPIDCHTGKFAKIDEPATWATFEEACAFARENGADSLAYALDGKDGICCIDLDKCYDEENKLSSLAKNLLKDTQGTFCEESISEKGLHFFGKTNGMDVRAFSKDGDMEFYQKSHFITMTGNVIMDGELKNIDQTPAADIIRSKCEKRTPLLNAGKGVEGLSSMSDRDVVEKACSSKHGETFKALYNGQDLQNNHSNSDMSLMNRLAFWCNGDKEQMLRIFATSGLYRPEKSADYYECTVIKALQGQAERYQPKQIILPKPFGSGSDNGGKR